MNKFNANTHHTIVTPSGSINARNSLSRSSSLSSSLASIPAPETDISSSEYTGNLAFHCLPDISRAPVNQFQQNRNLLAMSTNNLPHLRVGKSFVQTPLSNGVHAIQSHPLLSIGSTSQNFTVGPMPMIHPDAGRQKNDVNGTQQPPNTTVPEFLYQLTKMLTDNNAEVIEWSNGKIEVHNPERLANDVLQKYFRHSKYASFQRQLNYFGFRKLAGKGKMAPCSYTNDATSRDIRSLLTIKRKTNGIKDKKIIVNKDSNVVGSRLIGQLQSQAAMKSMSTRSQLTRNIGFASGKINSGTSGNKDFRFKVNQSIIVNDKIVEEIDMKPCPTPIMHNIEIHSDTLSSTRTEQNNINPGLGHVALARAAIGKGVKHTFEIPFVDAAKASVTRETPSSRQSIPDPLSVCKMELTKNFQNHINTIGGIEVSRVPNTTTSNIVDVNSLFKSNSSLFDLAIIPPAPQVSEPMTCTNIEMQKKHLMNFIDFPQMEVNDTANHQPHTG